jgi:glycosyltransferase involved in cell wall biosynthesis
VKRLRILWVSHFVPYPPKGGCFQRSYNLIRRVAASNELHLIAIRHKRSTHPDSETGRARDELLKHCRSVDIVDIADRMTYKQLALRGVAGLFTADPLSVSIYRSDEVRSHMRRLMAQHRFDVVHLDTISLAEYRADAALVPTVMTHHGAESWMIRRRIRREPDPFKRLFFVAEWLMLQRYERRMCPRVDGNVVMSEFDRALLEEVAPGASFTVVGNGVDIDFFTPVEPSNEPAIVFAGRLDQYSNREGILYFLREVWPLVRRAYPSAVLHVIGMNPPRTLEEIAAADAQVKLHGFVPDVRPYFRSAGVAICPVRDGGGTRIKILDGLAQGIPMVTTTIGCEGLAVTPERDVLIADTPEDFARQIGRVFDDVDLRRTLSRYGRQLVVTRYSWDALAARLNEVYHQVASTRQKLASGEATPARADSRAGMRSD